MPLPKNEYLSDIWKDGIFGRTIVFSATDIIAHRDDQIIKSFSVQAVQAQSAARKSELWFI